MQRLNFVLGAILLGLFGVVGAVAQVRTVAVTVDDLPYAGGEAGSASDTTDAKEINRKLLSALRRHRAPVTGFVVQKSVEELGLETGTKILREWTKGDFDLGNHTYSHPDINELTPAQIEDEITRGEATFAALMKRVGKKVEFFRFPMNHTGDTQLKHEQVMAFLARRGYRLAACTIDNSDYLFNTAYLRLLAEHDPAVQKLRVEYLAYTDSEIDYYAGLNKQVFGYEPAAIMLLHDNRLNADLIDELLALFEKKQYKFVSLSRALSDAAYQISDTYISKYGPMWGYRWAAERGVKVNGKLEPEPPDWILRSSEQR